MLLNVGCAQADSGHFEDLLNWIVYTFSELL